MFSPNVKNGVLVSRFDEISTHLNHQLSFSPFSNKGHLLVDDKYYKFEVEKDGNLFSPHKISGYDYHKGKSYLGHYNELNFSSMPSQLESPKLESPIMEQLQTEPLQREPLQREPRKIENVEELKNDIDMLTKDNDLPDYDKEQLRQIISNSYIRNKNKENLKSIQEKESSELRNKQQEQYADLIKIFETKNKLENEKQQNSLNSLKENHRIQEDELILKHSKDNNNSD